MCGICGIFQLGDKSVDVNLLHKMTEEIKHRGPDDEGYSAIDSNADNIIRFSGNDTIKKLKFPFIKDCQVDLKIAFGFRRLSIIDLSHHGHQPMVNDDESIMLAFNGEIYNYLEIREELKDIGHEFNSNTDTEVVLHSYIEWGEECVKKFNGMWAFALYDKKNNILFASRDRYGIKPFYYHFDNGTFIFASEIKQILLSDNVKREVEEEAAVNYLFSGFKDYSKKTFFKDIFQLEPSHNIVICNNEIKINKYWNTTINDKYEKNKNPKEVEGKFYSLFESSVKLRHRADVPVGIALSGGLDSSSTAVMANTFKKTVFKTFTMVFDDKKYDEREYAKLVADNINCTRFEHSPDIKQFKNELKEMVYHFEEPFRSASVFSQWCLMKIAKENGITVLLEGQGADELIAGYEWYYNNYFIDLINRFSFFQLIKELNAYSNNYKVKFISVIKNIFVAYMKFVSNKIRIKSGFFKIMSQQSKDHHSTYKSNYKNQLTKELDYGIHKLIRELLNYGDKNSMKYSVENRVPFLDYRLVDYVESLPLNWKIENATTKKILRDSLREILPKEIRNRYSKLGFTTPQELWQKNELKDIIKTELFSDEFLSLPYFKKEEIINYIESYFNGKHNNYSFIWRCFNFMCWKRRFGVK